MVRDAPPPPCRLMDEIFETGSRTALHRRAGVMCRVLTDGEITVGAHVNLGPVST